jgi:hypothetical protein
MQCILLKAYWKQGEATEMSQYPNNFVVKLGVLSCFFWRGGASKWINWIVRSIRGLVVVRDRPPEVPNQRSILWAVLYIYKYKYKMLLIQMKVFDNNGADVYLIWFVENWFINSCKMVTSQKKGRQLTEVSGLARPDEISLLRVAFHELNRKHSSGAGE